MNEYDQLNPPFKEGEAHRVVIGGASRWAILVLFKSATIKYGVLQQEGKNGRFYEAKVALDFDL